MSTHNIYIFMERWRKLSCNYQQILLLNSSAHVSPLNDFFCFRQKLIADRMAKMDNLIREYKKQQAKKPEEELRQKRKKEELLEAAEEYYGHKIETKGDKYKEFMANRAEADKARRKAEKKSQKKKSSEEALRHVLEKAGGKEKKQTASNVESDDEV